MTSDHSDEAVTPSAGSAPRAQGAMGNLDHDQLLACFTTTLDTPRRRYRLGAKALFALLDAVYGKARTLSKFKVLELVARVPYQAWEQVAYIAITHTHDRPTWPGGSSTGSPRAAARRTTSSGTYSSSRS